MTHDHYSDGRPALSRSAKRGIAWAFTFLGATLAVCGFGSAAVLHSLG